MPPADPATLSATLATVRQGEPVVGDRGYATYLTEYLAATELLAREFVRLLDAGELVRVRGLEWKLCNRSSIKTWRAETVFGELVVQSKGYWFAADHNRDYRECKNLKDGMKQAESHYRARLAAALEPLIAKEVGT